MTNQEFSNEFDILYNNISNGIAPGVNEYEKSVFLTKAQELLIKDLYTGNNALDKSFNTSEEMNQYINSLVKQESLYEVTDNYLGKSFGIPTDVLFIVLIFLEKEGKQIPVKNITYDEYVITKENPFKCNKKRALGITSSTNIIVKYSEDFDNLIVYYLSKPNPIILEDLNGVTINGISDETQTNVPEIIHYEILNKAVQIALVTNNVIQE